jgi:Ca2+-binding RTX toxin-like protein
VFASFANWAALQEYSMPAYTSFFLNSTTASNVLWIDSTVQSPTTFTNITGTLAAMVNADGTWTVFHGDIGGLGVDAQGNLQGTARWITHTTAGGAAGFFGAFEFASFGGVFDHVNVDVKAFIAAGQQDRYDMLYNRPGLVINGDAGDNLLGSGSFADVFNGNGGADHVTYGLSAAGVTADLAGIEAATGEAAGDVFNSIEHLIGSDFGDRLLGDGLDNTIKGISGDDQLFGRNGSDTLLGGSGNDVLNGGSGNDTLDGGPDGIDELSYQGTMIGIAVFLDNSGSGVTSSLDGEDTYFSIENLRGGNGNDTLWGNQGDNTVSGEAGDDKLYGNLGNDTLNGGLGNDFLYGLEGNDIIYGGGGVDTLDFTIGPMPSVSVLMDDDGNGTVTMAFYGTDTFFGISNLLGTNGGDTLGGSNGANLLQGNDGNDTLYGGGGNDRVEGGDGNDTLFGDADWGLQGGSSYIGDDIVLGGRGQDTLIATLGNDTLSGGQGIDVITYANLFDDAGNGDYYIVADLANSTVTKYFIDYFDGQSYLVGTDTVNAGETDSFETFQGTTGSDTLTDSADSGFFHGGAGHDTYKPMTDGVSDWSYDSVGFDTIDYGLATSAVTVGLYGVAAGQASGGRLGNYNFTGIDQHILTRFNDIFSSSAGSSSGNDTVFGMGGNDIIGAGLGADTLDGGSGFDTLSYKTSSAGVTVNLASGSGLGGAAQGDIVSGFERILGSAFDDRLTGDRFKNQLTGDLGRDVLRGGNGADAFVYKNLAESTVAASGRDLIADFDANAADIIDLFAIDARSATGTANDAFLFIGTASFTGVGQLRYVQQNGNTFVEANTGGTLDADMRIMLNGLVTLDVLDFRL